MIFEDDAMLESLVRMVAWDVPHQFVPDLLLPVLTDECARLRLPAPEPVAGNLVVGDLSSARFVLAAHLDEASFSVIEVYDGQAMLAPCHRFRTQEARLPLTFVGVRRGGPGSVAHGIAKVVGDSLRCSDAGDVRLGDRAVYRMQTVQNGRIISAKAIDDRAGAIAALHAMAALLELGVPCAVTLSDGEQNLPDGYFSRTFPQLLRKFHSSALVIFIDGIFGGRSGRSTFLLPPSEALVVPHSGDGRGYTVPPRLFARLRDEVIPGARSKGIDVRASCAYHSRGDDWGMVTNPTSGVNHAGFFVSFGGTGDSPQIRDIDVRALQNCARFAAYAVKALSGGEEADGMG